MLDYFEDTLANVGLPESWLDSVWGEHWVKASHVSNPVKHGDSNQAK